MASSSRWGNRTEDDIPQLWEERQSKNTIKSTKAAAKMLTQFCLEYRPHNITDTNETSRSPFYDIGLKLQEEDLNAELLVPDLDKILSLFYVNVKKSDGSQYKKNSLIGLRHGLARYFVEKYKINIIEDYRFSGANLTFKSALVELKKAGLASATRYQEISKDHLKLIYSSFDTSCPFSLQKKVIFDILFYLCRRGKQNLETMTKNTFIIETDSGGRRFLKQGNEDMTNQEETEDDVSQSRMYEVPGNSLCPVFSFEKYISKLNPIQERLWQRPKTTRVTEDTLLWYSNSPIGLNKLASFMSELSKELCLPKYYTNHCVRVTPVTSLKMVAEPRHQNEQSVDEMRRKRPGDESFGTRRKKLCAVPISIAPKPNLAKDTAATLMCGLSCDGVEGVPPQLQCERCLSLYHPICVGQMDDKHSFMCQKCVIGTAIKLEPVDTEDDQNWATVPSPAPESLGVVVKEEPIDFESELFNSSQESSQSLVIKTEPVDSVDEAEWQPTESTILLWSSDQLFREELFMKPVISVKRKKVPGISTSHVFPLRAVFAEKIDQHLPLTISVKGVNIKVPPFGYLEFVRPGADFQVILSPGVLDTLDRKCSDDAYSFIASCNPSDPQNIILQDLISQPINDVTFGLESKSFCTTVISAFGEEEEYPPMKICHNCFFMCKKCEGKMSGSTVKSFICSSCMTIRSSIITEDFNVLKHVPTDPRSRLILDTIDAQESNVVLDCLGSDSGSETSGKDIQFAQRGHLIRLPNRLLDRTRLTQQLVLTINGARRGVPPNGKVLLSKQYGAQVFIPERVIKSVGITDPENKSFIVMTSPNDSQNLVIQETGNKLQAKPAPSYHSGFFQTEITAALDFESAYKMVFNKEPPPPPPVLITDSGELHSEDSGAVSAYQNGFKRVPAFCPFQSLFGGYSCFLKIMSFLSIKDRLRARLVCRNWKEMLMHYSMWQEIALPDCVVTDWQMAAEFISQVNTRSLDLRGLVHFNGDENRTWHQFSSSLGRLSHLEDVEFDKCPAIILTTAAGKLPNLRSLSALQLTGPGTAANNAWSGSTQLNISKIGSLDQLEILQLRGVCALELIDGLPELARLTHLRKLSLTTMRNLGDPEMEIIGNLTSIEVLELGDCHSISHIGIDQLKKLINLTRLRLEYRPSTDDDQLADVLVSLESLCSLELVKIVLHEKLLEVIENLEQLKSLVVWPEICEKEAEENTAVLRTLSKMTFLDYLEWGITSNNPDDSAQTALFLDGDLMSSAIKSSLRTRSKNIAISKVMSDLCSNLTQTKIKVFKLKMPEVKSKTSASKTHLSSTQSASLRYVVNFLKSRLKPERSVAASRRALRL